MRASTAARSILALALAALAGAAAAQNKPPVFTSLQPAQARAPDAPVGDSERAMGTYALAVFNTQPFEFPASGGADPLPLTVYTVGLRHWTRSPLGPFKNWGWDAGLGLAFRRSSVTSPQAGVLSSDDGPALTGWGLHVGLPLAVTHHRHATFELVPELDVIYAHEKIPALDAGGDATSYSGWSARVGAKAGFEIYFGFVDLPQLAIEASLGLSLSYDSVKTTVGPIERSTRTWGIQTLRGNEPWSIFTGSVA
ncbi:MAG TPA: hypothetical protein VEB43_13080, partial [Anaeromyxobacter sp.]|nr:hypothetical protein [Anaeromyxobacter sp.]